MNNNGLPEEYLKMEAKLMEALKEDRPFTLEEQKFFEFCKLMAKDVLETRDKLNIHEDWRDIVNRKDPSESPVVKKIVAMIAENKRLEKEIEKLKCTGKKS